MVAVSHLALKDLSNTITTCRHTFNVNIFNDVPVIDCHSPNAKTLVVKASKEFGFFKLTYVYVLVQGASEGVCGYSEVVEMLAEEMGLESKDTLSKMTRDENSGSCLRLNHYPTCPELQALKGRTLIGFGKHTDP